MFGVLINLLWSAIEFEAYVAKWKWEVGEDIAIYLPCYFGLDEK